MAEKWTKMAKNGQNSYLGSKAIFETNLQSKRKPLFQMGLPQELNWWNLFPKLENKVEMVKNGQNGQNMVKILTLNKFGFGSRSSGLGSTPNER